MAETHIKGHTEALIPGRYLVNTIPALRFVPSWVPGTGWKKDLANLLEMNEETTVRPWEDAKTREAPRDHPSLASQLLAGLPSVDHPEYSVREEVAKGVAAVAYLGGADTVHARIASTLVLS